MRPRLRGLLPTGAFLGLVLAGVPASAADRAAIDAAVDKGVQYLRALQGGAGIWQHDQIGMTALAGLTLLECGVPIDDPAIQKAASALRHAAPTQEQTYSISLTILFLDRLGEDVDVALIEALTVRLLNGQTKLGGWSYTCPRPPFADQRRLNDLVKQHGDAGVRQATPRPDKGKTRTLKDLPRDIQAQLEQIRRQPGAAVPELANDNSNTQFAILGLWVARRHGLPVDDALGRTEKWFRNTQAADGSWGYVVPSGVGAVPVPGTPAMTCAGLLGLGLAYGAWNEAALRTDAGAPEAGKPATPSLKPKDPSKDKAVVAAFRLLGLWIDAMARKGGKAPRLTFADFKFYYFLWSLERVAVAYGIDRIGATDWYDWAADVLLANQGPQGGWDNGGFRNGPDTCFALLVLKRANLAKDLTRSLTSQMKNGLQTALRQGGVGGSNLVKGRKAFFDGPAAEDPRDHANGGEDRQAARLGTQLAAARGERQQQLLKELRDNKGAAYTQALAGAIPRLEGDALKKARDALAERLARMTSDTLSAKLEDDDAEVRRAAALAVAMKDDRHHVYKLIELLNDPEVSVTHAAHAALKALSQEDYGPARDATRQERAKAVLAWKAWWTRQREEKK